MLQDGKYFKVSELACHDGTPYPEYYQGRLVQLLRMLDKIRAGIGVPVQVVSGYRTPAYNARLAKDSTAHQVASGSQHIEGRAADLRPTRGVTVQVLYEKVLAMHAAGELDDLGGIGIYPESDWLHVDTFKAPDGHLRRWTGT
jgi:uncharacterized protein YcbK (DUF882 family)